MPTAGWRGSMAAAAGSKAGSTRRWRPPAGAGAAPHGVAMGFARLQGGRTTLIADAAAPPAGRASAEAHASTLAFELTSGRRPIVVSCGSGRSFGPDWRRAGRATPSHSTLCLDGISSSRLAVAGQAAT